MQEQKATATTRRWTYDHHRLDAWHVALEALVLGNELVKGAIRGNGAQVDQLKRALSGM